MIDDDKPDDGPIVAAVRRAREEISAEHNYDPDAMFEAMRRAQATPGRTYATPARRTAPAAAAPTDPKKKAG